jgi:serine/tyrosine/threonine adenylyltransferase
MAENKADFTLTFRRLSDVASAGPEADGPVRSLFYNAPAFDVWAARWRQRLAQEGRHKGRPAGRDADCQPRLHPAQS